MEDVQRRHNSDTAPSSLAKSQTQHFPAYCVAMLDIAGGPSVAVATVNLYKTLTQWCGCSGHNNT